jgi:hypothetical protein
LFLLTLLAFEAGVGRRSSIENLEAGSGLAGPPVARRTNPKGGSTRSGATGCAAGTAAAKRKKVVIVWGMEIEQCIK